MNTLTFEYSIILSQYENSILICWSVSFVLPSLMKTKLSADEPSMRKIAQPVENCKPN